MPSGKPRPASAAEIAKYGHIAALIRRHMDEHNMRGPEFAAQVGFANTQHLSQLYKWIGAKAGPGPRFRNKVAKVLGVKPSEIMPRDGTETTPVTITAKKSGDVLQFSIDAEGNCRLKFDATLPVLKGVPLLRIVLETANLMKSWEE